MVRHHAKHLADLLAATDIERQQPSLFPYNFRYIPVELLSGVYESFLGRDQKKSLAAYYTPRHLASLVVDQALSASSDLLSEKVYDGACGSGILLTTAFRRLLGEAEARRGAGPLPLRERIELLRGHIFGSDLSEAACRVTAFSLYLSLLERLEPADVVALCEDAQVKLPRLRGSNLFGGVERGDFFSDANPNTRRTDYTLLLSNPPWMETGLDEDASDDERAAAASLARWVGTTGIPRTLNQIAADFAWRASDIAAPGARLCLILPMSLLLKPTSQPFLTAWLERVRWRQLVNFGDLKELLFDDGRLSCAVLLAERRADPPYPERSAIGPGESFEYWASKADASLAMGRLTLHGVDRHTVLLWLDGVYDANVEPPRRKPRLRRARAPTSAQLTQLANTIAHRVCRHLSRRGWLEGEDESVFLSDSAGSDDGMDGLRMSSMTYRIATGRDAGRKVVPLQTLRRDAGPLEGDAGKVGGFSPHAGVAAEAHESHKLEKLCRYITRPAISEQRLS